MILYLGVFFLAVFLYLVNINQPKSIGALKGMMFFLAIFVGISDMLGGYDRYIYGECFDRAADALQGQGELLSTPLFFLYAKELGYCALNLLVATFSSNRYIFIFIVTIIIYVCLYQAFKRHTNNYAFAIILFLGLWFFFSFTYLRQVLGASIAWLAIRYVSERNLKRFLIVVFIAATFHNSGIMFIPLYFIPIKSFSKQKIIMVMAVLLILGLTGGPGALFDAYGSATSDDRAHENLADTSGIRIAYLIEAIFFLYFILKNYDIVTKTKEQTVMTNAALVFCGILLFFVKSENGGRLSWYYMIGIISTLTYVAANQKRITSSALSLIVLSLFLYIRILTAWGVLLSPYKTFFTDGVRRGDYIYNNYEYDSSYANDKFYR